MWTELYWPRVESPAEKMLPRENSKTSSFINQDEREGHYIFTSITTCFLIASALPSLSREVIVSVGLTNGPAQPSLRRFKLWITRDASPSL